MKHLVRIIEETFAAAAFAEAGEHETARNMLTSGKNAHRKVLLSTDCPVVTGQVLDHALALCKRLGSGLEVFQLIPEADQVNGADQWQQSLRALQEDLARLGVAYRYAVGNPSLLDELTEVAGKRRDIMAVIVPVCEGLKEHREDFQRAISRLFNCPVMFFTTTT